ncbi:MAG: molybdenum cofactor biosynthesis protein C [Clostridiales bacterium GWC2_40_7]|nr:MAG: molybdenum cofactor biosynthesis protein C [Clostridiales bacterium GWC2_40_7]
MELTHIDEKGNARMVDVSGKEDSRREAVACGKVFVKREVLQLISEGRMPKGDVMAAARIAGIMAAKRTQELIPLCHSILLDSVEVELAADTDNCSINITAKVRCTGKTGVEMEALTAVSVAALTIYDMCKAVDKGMTVTDIMLIRKTGGKSGEYIRKL